MCILVIAFRSYSVFPQCLSISGHNEIYCSSNKSNNVYIPVRLKETDIVFVRKHSSSDFVRLHLFLQTVSCLDRCYHHNHSIIFQATYKSVADENIIIVSPQFGEIISNVLHAKFLPSSAKPQSVLDCVFIPSTSHQSSSGTHVGLKFIGVESTTNLVIFIVKNRYFQNNI